MKNKNTELNHNNLLTIKVWGWSMYPNIKDADVVILKKEKPNLGDVVCFKNKDKYIIHRVVKLKKGYLVTKGDNCFTLDFPIKKEEVVGVGIAIKRQNKILPIKGKYLYGYFYPLSWIIIALRKVLKEIILKIQSFKFYPKIVRYVFRNKNIEIEKPVETCNFYFIRAKINGREAGWLKIYKKNPSTFDLYVKIYYRGLGIEKKLLRQRFVLKSELS